MLGSRRGRTVIGDGLKILGHVTADGLVEVNGQIEGDLRCTSLIVSPKAQIVGSITAERVVVNGRVEGPIQGGEVVLKSQAHVVGDIHHQSLTIEKCAYWCLLKADDPKYKRLWGSGDPILLANAVLSRPLMQEQTAMD